MKKKEQALIIENTDDIFSLDRQTLCFSGELSSMPNKDGIYGSSGVNLIVSNLTNKYIGVRTKTTKTKEYAVSPTYCLIPPKDKATIQFVHFVKDIREDAKDHKFLFEGIVIDEMISPQFNLRKYFENLIQNQKPVKGNSMKRGVIFDFKSKINQMVCMSPVAKNSSVAVNNDDFTKVKNNAKESTTKVEQQPSISQIGQGGQGGQERSTGQNEKEYKEQLESLKVEYYKYKNKLSLLIENYSNLCNRVDMERPPGEKEVKAVLPEKIEHRGEYKISRFFVAPLLLLSLVLGFMLAH